MNIQHVSLKMAPVCRNYFRYCAAFPLQMQLQKISKQSCTAFQKVMCVRTQRFSEEAFRIFGRNLPI